MDEFFLRRASMLIINGEKVPEVLIEHEINRLKPHYERQFADQDQATREQQLREWAKENVVEHFLFRQEAAKDERPVDEQEVADKLDEVIKRAGGEDTLLEQSSFTGIDQVKAEIEKDFKADRLMKEVQSHVTEPDDDTIKQHYEKHKNDRYKTPEQVRAAHIVKHCKGTEQKKTAWKEISKAQKDLDAGKSFEDVAGASSDCADNAGDLGYFPRGRMVQEFEDVVFDELEIGQVSDIFWTGFGYHIAKKYDHVQAGPVGFEAARESIHNELLTSRKQEAIYVFLDRLKEKADIREA
ncbi:MAG: hypothetical protein GF398_03235 [Chitinivibrionales bacterium]|nr:hypothetical protein [Chitinivibrionales bacterium]